MVVVDGRRSMAKAKDIINEDNILKILDEIYLKACDGIPKVNVSVEEMADDYLNRHTDINKAAKSMLNHQVAKCTTSGVVTGFGGLITLPVTVPANLSSVLYVQMRMVACAAHMGGYDLKSDQVKTFIYACMAGVSVNGIAKRFAIELGNKMANAAIKKIPGKVLTKINQKIGFRFITKFGEKGLINLGKMVPGVGAAINGGMDFVETKAIASRAYNMFIKGNFDVGEEIEDIEDIIPEVVETTGVAMEEVEAIFEPTEAPLIEESEEKEPRRIGKYYIRKTNTGIKFDLKAANGEVIATSEVYKSKTACLNGIKSVRTNAFLAELEDQTNEDFEKCKNPKYEMYLDKAGEHRFRLKAKNGQIIATSEGYKAKKSCLNGIESVRVNSASEIIEEE